MKKNYVVLMTVIATALFSCKKDPVNPSPSNGQQGKLKDIVIQNLPSPYYRFVYNSAGDIINAGYYSDIRTYIVKYASGRVSEMQGTSTNKDRLVYEYDNNKVSLIKYINPSGINYRRCFISYNAAGLLEKMEWEIKMTPAGFSNDRSLSFSYYADGNLLERKDHLYRLDGQQDVADYTDRFEAYDNKINVDGFSLLLDENGDHLVLLPGVTLQKNNPRKYVRSGTGINYKIDYTYLYNTSNKPLQKTGAGVFTSGASNGQVFQSITGFSYY